VMTGEMNDPAEQLKNVQAFHLLADRKNYYFASQLQGQNAVPMNMLASNVMTHLGMRTVPVSGFLHSFERASGNLVWNSHIKTPQYLVLEQFQDLPLLFLTARTQANQNLGGPPGMVAGQMVVKVTTLMKSNGKAVFDEEMQGNSTTNFFGVRVDPRARTVELLSQRMKITHSPVPPVNKKAEPAAAGPRPQGTPTSASLPQKKETRVNRPAFDRAGIREIAPPPPG
jgi:hypothetical protein